MSWLFSVKKFVNRRYVTGDIISNLLINDSLICQSQYLKQILIW